MGVPHNGRMGMFTQKPEEDPMDWTGLPSEPLERAETDLLNTSPAADPLALGLGLGGTTSSIAFPIPSVAPEVSTDSGSAE